MSIMIPILTYHSIDDSGSVISTHPQKFRDQMQILYDRRFNIISLSDLVALMHNKQPLPSKTAVITFDDGFKNFYLKAYPILQEFGFSATVFLVPGYIGKTSEWNATSRGIPVLDLLEWSEIREMVKSGIDFGAHTMNHTDLSRLSREQARQEIVDSKLLIQKYLEKDAQFFAYPYGRLTNETKAIVKDEFLGACSVTFGFVDRESNVYTLPRIDMYYFSRNKFFRFIGTPMFSVYIIFRSVLRSINNNVHIV